MIPAALAGRTALVTGASRGLGRHVALELARAGADVAVLARTLGDSESAPESVRAVAAEVRALGRRALDVAVDLADDAALGDAVERVRSAWGGIDILINNAGIVATQPLLQMPLRRLDLLWRINVRAPALLIQACAPGMIERGAGHIINIGSLSSQVRGAQVPLGFAGYTSTKAALVRMSHALALELKPHGVAVNALVPTGLVETEGWLRVAKGQRLPNAEPIDYVGRAVAWIAAQDPAHFSGRFLDSQQVLVMAGQLERPALTFADLPQVDVSKWAEG